jgi:hypothetical protein
VQAVCEFPEGIYYPEQVEMVGFVGAVQVKLAAGSIRQYTSNFLIILTIAGK